MARTNLFRSSKFADVLKQRGWSYQDLSNKMNEVFSSISMPSSKVRPSNVHAWVKGSDISGSYLAVLLFVLQLKMSDLYPNFEVYTQNSVCDSI